LNHVPFEGIRPLPLWGPLPLHVTRLPQWASCPLCEETQLRQIGLPSAFSCEETQLVLGSVTTGYLLHSTKLTLRCPTLILMQLVDIGSLMQLGDIGRETG
jgi:hypothetical protein